LSPQEPGPYAPATLLAHAQLGTVVHLAEGWDGRQAAALAIGEIVRRDGVEPYIIPMGGTNPLGVLGYVDAALELASQIDGRSDDVGRGVTGFAEPDVVYVAAGTLGTAVGLAIGFAVAGLATRVEAISVTPPEIASEAVARKLVAGAVNLLRSLSPDFPQVAYEALSLRLRSDRFEPGYGVVTPETEEAVGVAASWGIEVETTYTGEAFSAMLADARSGRLRGGERVLFWNTYSSAPKPGPGPIEALPPALRDYIAECELRFGASR
jgi:D-cysteine desulfhydrase